MEINLLEVGKRVRQIKEEVFDESRRQFCKRCDLSEKHLATIERGDVQIKLNTLNKIISATGTDANYILYGNNNNKNLQVFTNLQNIMNRSDKEELEMYYKCIVAFRSYMIKKEDEK